MYPAAVAIRTYPGTLLTSRQLQLSHCTGSDDLSQEFFLPCLDFSILYWRAAGYCTSADLGPQSRLIDFSNSQRTQFHLMAA
jgi:hypothetical protein